MILLYNILRFGLTSKEREVIDIQIIKWVIYLFRLQNLFFIFILLNRLFLLHSLNSVDSLLLLNWLHGLFLLLLYSLLILLILFMRLLLLFFNSDWNKMNWLYKVNLIRLLLTIGVASSVLIIKIIGYIFSLVRNLHPFKRIVFPRFVNYCLLQQVLYKIKLLEVTQLV